MNKHLAKINKNNKKRLRFLIMTHNLEFQPNSAKSVHMDHSIFQDSSPGRLVPTTFTEYRFVDGQLRAEDVTGVAFVPDLLPPRFPMDQMLIELYPAIIAAERTLSELEGSAKHLPNPHMLIDVFARREAILSSAIEDTFSSAEQLALLDIDPEAVENRDQTREVYNYIRALNHGLESDLPISLRLIRDMHRILLEGSAKGGMRSGEYRHTQNAIGSKNRPFSEARFVPPPPHYLEDLLNDVEKFCNTLDTTLPRLVRFAMIHYQFEAIHPFLDGNGRLGRLLVTLMLCRQGQLSRPLAYVSGFFEQNRQEYYDHLLGVSTHGAWYAWIEFFLRAIVTQCEDALHRADRLLALQNDFHRRVRESRAPALVSELIDRLFLRPVVTAASARDSLGCSHQTAFNYINRLVNMEILSEMTGGTYGKRYVCRPIVDLINR